MDAVSYFALLSVTAMTNLQVCKNHKMKKTFFFFDWLQLSVYPLELIEAEFFFFLTTQKLNMTLKITPEA